MAGAGGIVIPTRIGATTGFELEALKQVMVPLTGPVANVGVTVSKPEVEVAPTGKPKRVRSYISESKVHASAFVDDHETFVDSPRSTVDVATTDTVITGAGGGKRPMRT